MSSTTDGAANSFGSTKWLHPSGPRILGEGVEDEEQGIIEVTPTQDGGAMLRITLLAAGFVIGPNGICVRQICKQTKADIKSWTHQQGLMSDSASMQRSCRNFLIQGAQEAVVLALHIICDAVDRYKELCEGRCSGQHVFGVQQLHEIDFYYRPPPRNLVPHAAALQDEHTRTAVPSASEGKTAEAESIFAQVKQTIAAQRQACRQDAAASPFALPLSKLEQADLTLAQAIASKQRAKERSGPALHSPDSMPSSNSISPTGSEHPQQLNAGQVSRPSTASVSMYKRRPVPQAPAGTVPCTLQLPPQSLSITASELTSRAASAPSLQHLRSSGRTAHFDSSQCQPCDIASDHGSNGSAVGKRPDQSLHNRQTEQARLVQLAAQAKLHQDLHQQGQIPVANNATRLQPQVSHSSTQHAVPSWCMNASGPVSAQRSLRQWLASGQCQNEVPFTRQYNTLHSDMGLRDTQQPNNSISPWTHAQNRQLPTPGLHQQAHLGYAGIDMHTAHMSSKHHDASAYSSVLLMQALQARPLGIAQGQPGQWMYPIQHPMQQGMHSINAAQPGLAPGWHSMRWQQPAVHTVHPNNHMPGPEIVP